MKNFKTIDPKDLTTREIHKILLNAVTPRPIALASTIDKNGNVNLSPLVILMCLVQHRQSWFFLQQIE